MIALRLLDDFVYPPLLFVFQEFDYTFLWFTMRVYEVKEFFRRKYVEFDFRTVNTFPCVDHVI